MDQAGDAQAVFGNVILDGMASHYNGFGLSHLVIAPPEYGLDRFKGKVLREHEDVHTQSGFPAHGPYVGQGVGGSNLAVLIGIIHSRRKDVHGLYQGKLRGKLIDGRIVGGVIPNQKPVIVKGW